MKKLLIATILGLCLLVLLGDYVCNKGIPCHPPLFFMGKNATPSGITKTIHINKK